ncbi:MAG TPA: hypothetical protein VEQ62_00355, partial [Stellaceae bacterium]|nr:hypothetical protein [Stellaceae bacterium]
AHQIRDRRNRDHPRRDGDLPVVGIEIGAVTEPVRRPPPANIFEGRNCPPEITRKPLTFNNRNFDFDSIP